MTQQPLFHHECQCSEPKLILSLCDFSGEWSRPYWEAGYPVLQVDPKLEFSVTAKPNAILFSKTVQEFSCQLEDYNPFRKVHGILMAPPCTHFTVSGAQYWDQKDLDGRTAEGLEIIDACLQIKDLLAPCWWVLENPVGRLPKLRPDDLGDPVMYWNPCNYGDPYTKKTGLWGVFNKELPRYPVEPVRSCSQGSWVQQLGGKSERTKELRSVTPAGFARAFFKANP